MMGKCVLIPLVLAQLCALAAGDILIDDFESGSYDNWKVEGEAFGSAPAKGAFPNQKRVFGYKGNFLVNTYLNNRDQYLGKLTSKPFKVERKYLSALVGGGDSKDWVYLRVLVDGKEVGRITGHSREELIPRAINLENYQGKTAVVEIVDNASGGFGHINVDDIKLSDKPDGIVTKASATIEKARRYVNIPISYKVPERMVKISDPENTTVLIDAKIRVDFENPEWIFPLETRELEGGPLRIEMESKIGEDVGLKTSDNYVSADYPNELLRPQYHFSPPHGWMNDPNGLVYWKGKWNMYYQFSPHSVHSREKAWGHTVSDDLIYWQHRPIGINTVYYPRGGNNAIWSGTAFADLKNRSGLFGEGGGIVFAYTLIGRGDYIAYSKDGYDVKTLPDPIATAHGRDPCIFYHEPTSKWVVLRYEFVKRDESAPGAKKFVFYTSKDLKTWERGQVLDDFYECPYIVSMPVNGDRRNMKYLIFDARGECVVGDFDGEKFTPIGGRRPKFVLGDAYAGQVFHNAPKGRTVKISWMIQKPEDFGFSALGFSQMMCLPMELRLVEESGGYEIRVEPSPEVKKLYAGEKRFKGLELGDEPFKIGKLPGSFMLEANMDISKAEKVSFNIGPLCVDFSKSDNSYTVRSPSDMRNNPKTANLTWPDRRIQLEGKSGDELNLKIFVDRSSIEIYHCGKKMIGIYVPFGDGELECELVGRGALVGELVVRDMKKAFSKASMKYMQGPSKNKK